MGSRFRIYFGSFFLAVTTALTIGAAFGSGVVSGQIWYGGQSYLTSIESPHPYGPNTNLTWTINATGGSRVRVHFVQIATEQGYDFVRLLDSSNAIQATYS